MALMVLMKSGKQILRLSSPSSSAAAVAARSQRQQLGGVTAAASKCLFSTRSSCFGDGGYSFSTKLKPNKKDNNDFEIPPKTFKSIFTNLFRAPPPTGTPFYELTEKFMDMAERSKNCPEDRIPIVLDEIRPVLKEYLYRMTNESVTIFVYEFARPTASSPPPVVHSDIKAMVDKLPSHVIHLFQDLLIDVIEETYIGADYSITYDPNNRDNIVFTTDVSHIGKEHLKLIVVKNYLMVISIGTDKDAPPASSPRLLALSATIHKILSMPSCPYSVDDVTASILEDHELGKSKLTIVVPCPDDIEVTDKPRVFQLNLTRVQTHYKFSGKS